MFHSDAIPAEQDIALVNTGASSGTVGIEGHDHRAPAILDGHVTQARAEISNWNSTMLGELRCNAVDSDGWNHQCSAAGAAYGHAERRAIAADCQPSLGSATKTQVQFDALVDSSPSH